MTQLEHTLRHAVEDLTAFEVPFALIGGLAVSIRAEPRFTRDADLAVAVASDDEAEYLTEIVAEAERLEVLPGLMMPVAQVGHLLALKLLSQDDDQRPQDAVDLRALLLVASPHERERMRGAATLITQRGYNRGRDLASAIETLLAGRP